MLINILSSYQRIILIFYVRLESFKSVSACESHQLLAQKVQMWTSGLRWQERTAALLPPAGRRGHYGSSGRFSSTNRPVSMQTFITTTFFCTCRSLRHQKPVASCGVTAAKVGVSKNQGVPLGHTWLDEYYICHSTLFFLNITCLNVVSFNIASLIAISLNVISFLLWHWSFTYLFHFTCYNNLRQVVTLLVSPIFFLPSL